MELSIIYNLGAKIVEHCATSGSSSFSEYIKSDCFWFIVALLIATAIEGVGLDFLFTGSGSSTAKPSTNLEQGPKPSLEDFIDNSQPEPATSLAEIWASESPENITLQDVIE
jgi:hypothetical protein